MMHLADFNLRRAADVDGARAKIHECMLLLTDDRQRASQAASAFSEVARAIVEHCSARVEVSIGRIGESSEPLTRSSMLSIRIWLSCVTALAAQ